MSGRILCIAAAATLYAVTAISAQAPAAPGAPPPAQGAPAAPQGQAPAGGRAGGGAPAYPVRPPGDPAAIARGQTIFGTNCAFCHGADARGGERGPNLPRAQLVLNDRAGELISPVIQNGRPEQGMPKFDLSAANVADLVAFIHSVPVNLRGGGTPTPTTVAGDVMAGEAYFKARCASCHSTTGDLRGLGARFDARTLQNFWVSGGVAGAGRGGPGNPNSRPTTVTVTSANGTAVSGRLERIDDFFVTLTDDTGERRTFRRDSETSPTVVVRNPRQSHIDMFAMLRDSDIHNVTAFLMTVR